MHHLRNHLFESFQVPKSSNSCRHITEKYLSVKSATKAKGYVSHLAGNRVTDLDDIQAFKIMMHLTTCFLR